MKKNRGQSQAVKLKQRVLKLTPNISRWVSIMMFTCVLAGGLIFIYLSRSLTSNAVLTHIGNRTGNEQMSFEAGVQPQFEFYSILPEISGSAPDEIQALTQNLDKEENSSEVEDYYLLQVGSFRLIAESNKLKSELAPLGFEVNIREFNHEGVIWYRVLLGPFIELDDVARATKALQANNYDSLLLHRNAAQEARQ